MTTSRKLIIGGAIIVAVTAYMAYRGAAASWQYYLTTDECLADGASLAGRRIRVSGQVAPGTLDIAKDRSRASFSLAGQNANLKVVCRGSLPGNLVEGTAVLVEGRLDDTGMLQSEKVLTRCASKYESRLSATSAHTGRAKPEARL